MLEGNGKLKILMHPGARMIAVGVLVFVSLAVFIPGVTKATLDTPQLLSYQGRLTDAQKVTVPDGAQSMKFAIYDASVAGNCLWSAGDDVGDGVDTVFSQVNDCPANVPSTAISVTVTDGLFNTLLGASPQNALPDTIFNTTAGQERWLEIRIGAETLSPRRRLASSPSALQAGNASLLDNFDSSQAGGSVAFVPVTDSSGNLTLTKNLTVDSPTLFVDAVNNFVGVSTTTANGYFEVKRGIVISASASSDINALGTGTGTITLTSTASFPPKGTAIADSEAMSYTVLNGTQLTITARGVYGTAAVTHTNGIFVSSYGSSVTSTTAIAPQLLMTSNGRLGLSVAAPLERLHLLGNERIENAAPYLTLYDTTSGTQAYLQYGVTTAGTTGGNNLSVLLPAGKNFLLASGTSQITAYDSSGNFGIGAPNPNNRLQVQGDEFAGTGTASSSGTTFTGSGTLFLSEVQVGDTIRSANQYRRVTAVGTNLSLTLDSAFTPDVASGPYAISRPRFLVQAGGNVGIGKVSPSSALDVNGTVQMTGFKLSTTPTSGYVLTSDAGGVGTWQAASGGTIGGSIASPQLAFGTGANTVGGDANIVVDPTNGGIFVGYGTVTSATGVIGAQRNQNGESSISMQNTTNGSSAQASVSVVGPSLHNTRFTTFGSAYTGSDSPFPGIASAGLQANPNGTQYNLFLQTLDPTSEIGFFTGGVPGTERLHIAAGGNVGVGTSSPNTILDINGAFSVRGMSAPAVSPSGQGRIYFDSGSNTFKISQNTGAYSDIATALTAFVNGGNSFGADASLGTNDANNLAFETNNVERGRFTTTGNFMVGATALGSVHSNFVTSFGAAGNNIYAAGDIAAQGSMYADSFTAGDASTVYGLGSLSANSIYTIQSTGALTLHANTSGGADDISFQSAGTERMRLLENGNVGIGTPSPAAQLQVVSSSASTVTSIVKAAASQTANMSEWRNSSNSILTKVDPTGNVVTGMSYLAASTAAGSATTEENNIVDGVMAAAASDGSGGMNARRAVTLVTSDNLPLHAYISGGGALKVVKCATVNCGASVTTNTPVSSGVSGASSLSGMLGSDGFPFFVYRDTSASFKVAHCTDMSCTTSDIGTISGATSTGSSNAVWTSVALLGDGSAAIAYVADEATDTANYVRCANPSSATPCSSSSSPEIVGTGLVPLGINVNISSDGFPLVIFAASDSRARAVKCADNICTNGTQTVTNTGIWGDVTSSARLSTGHVVFVTNDNTEGGCGGFQARLNYVRCTNASCSSQSTSLYVDAVGGQCGQQNSAIVVTQPGDLPLMVLNNYQGASNYLLCGNTSCSSGNVSYAFTSSVGSSYDAATAAVNQDGDVIARFGGTYSGVNNFVARILLSSVVFAGTNLGAEATRLANGYFGGEIKAGSITIDGASPNGKITTSGNATFGDGTGADKFTVNMGDNLANAVDIQESTNDYFNVDTTNAAEKLTFGNATTNPTFSFLGTGLMGVGTASPGSRLEVKGTGSSSATSAMNITNSTGTSALFVRDDGNLGIGTTSPTSALAFGGNVARSIQSERHTTTNTAGNALSLIAGGATIGATDKNGGDLLLMSGTATGTGSSGIQFQTVTAGTTGTTDRTQTTKATLSGAGDFTLTGDYLTSAGAALSYPTPAETAYGGASASTPGSKLLVPSDGRPIVLFESSGSLHYRRCTATDCTTAGGDLTIATGITASNLDAEILSSGQIFIAVRDSSTGDMRVVVCTDNTCTTTNVNTSVVSGVSSNQKSISVSARSDGSAAIAYFNSSNEVRYFRCTNPTAGTPCTTMTTDNLIASSASTPITLETPSDAIPLIAYSADKIARCSTADCSAISGTQTIVTPSGWYMSGLWVSDVSPTTGFASFVLQSTPYAAHKQSSLVTCDNVSCTTWHVTEFTWQIFSTTQINVGLAMRSNGMPVVMYAFPNTGATTVLVCTTVDCTAYTPFSYSPGSLGVGVAVNSAGDAFLYFGSPRFVKFFLASATYSGTDLGSVSAKLSNGYFAGDLYAGTLSLTSGSSNLTVNGSSVLGDGIGADTLAVNLGDNIANALDVQQGSYDYLNINTTDSSENISFGNTVTNPSFTFLGTGALSFGGSLVPNTDNAQDLGSPIKRWQDLYLGPASLNIYNQADATNYDAVTLGYESNVATFRSSKGGTGTARAIQILTGAGSTPALYADTSNNVGIGTTSPAYDLEVKKASNVSISSTSSSGSSTAYSAASNDSGGNYAELAAYGDSIGGNAYGTDFAAARATLLYLGTNGGTAGISAFGPSSLRLLTSSVTRVTIDTSGNVGIGDTSPAALFTVGASDAFQVDSTGRVFANVGASGAGNLAYSFVGDTDTGLYRSAANEMRFQTGGSDRVTIDTSGNVGIGTTSPDFKLQVDGIIAPEVDNTYDLGTSALRWKTLHLGPGSLVVHNDATNTLKASLDFSGTTAQLITDAATPLQLTTGANPGLQINTAGFVGINHPYSGTFGTGVSSTVDQLLHLRRQGGSNQILMEGFGAGSGATITGRRANGTIAVPTAVANGGQLFGINVSGYDGTSAFADYNGSTITASQTWTPTTQGFRQSFYVNANGTNTLATRAFVIENDGKLSNGIISPVADLQIANVRFSAAAVSAGNPGVVTGANAAIRLSAFDDTGSSAGSNLTASLDLAFARGNRFVNPIPGTSTYPSNTDVIGQLRYIGYIAAGDTQSAGAKIVSAATEAWGAAAAGQDLEFFTNANGTVNTPLLAMTITQNQRVGIGDATPAAMFTVGSGDLFQVSSAGNVVFQNDADHTISTTSSSGTAGRKLSISAGNGSSSGDIGGDLVLSAGTSNDSSGGNVNIFGGTGSNGGLIALLGGSGGNNFDTGGAITLTGGTGNNNTGGAITIATGSGNASGDLSLSSGNAGSTFNSGHVYISSGIATGGGTSGNVYINSAAAGGGTSGDVIIDVGSPTVTKGTVQIGVNIVNTITLGRTGGTKLDVNMPKIEFNAPGALALTERLCHDGGSGDGVAISDGAIADCAAAGQADYAEQYPIVSGATYGDIMVAGTTDVTTTQGDTIKQLVKSSTPYAMKLIGVISNNYDDASSIGYNINPADNPMPIALVGRVKVKVNDENGAIAVGDAVTTSSTAGVGMKATQTGFIIGRALSSFTGPGAGTVMVFVNTQYYVGATLTSDGSVTTLNDALAVSGNLTIGKDVSSSITVIAGSESLRSGAENNIFVTKLPKLSVTGGALADGNCSSGAAEGWIFQNDAGTQVGHACVDATDKMNWYAESFNSTGTDIAESYNAKAGEVIEKGDVVALDIVSGEQFTVTKADATNANIVLGIIATRPGIKLSGVSEDGTRQDNARPVFVALAGRVPTNVNDQNGPIAIGDMLTMSSTPGVAMKRTNSGPMIGRALRPLASGTGKIEVFVHLEYLPQNAASQVVQQQTNNFAIFGDLDFAGYSIMNIKAIRGTNWSIDETGALVVKSVSSEEYIVKNTAEKATIDTAYIPPGSEMVIITNPAVHESSRIFLTFRSDPGTRYWINNQNEGSFEVRLGAPASMNTRFEYWIVNVVDERLAAPPIVTPADPAVTPTPAAIPATEPGSSGAPAETTTPTAPAESTVPTAPAETTTPTAPAEVIAPPEPMLPVTDPAPALISEPAPL